MENSQEVKELKDSLKQRRTICWTKCGSAARFGALATTLYHQNLLSKVALNYIHEDMEYATKGAKAEYDFHKKVVLEKIANLQQESKES